MKIGIVGKYFDTGKFRLSDSYISVIEAIKHAASANKVKPKIEWINSKDFEKDENKVKFLDEMNGVIVPGGFGTTGTEGKILAIKYVRENDIPFLGICFGLQLAVVEFARNVCKLIGANSTEINPNTPHPVVDLLSWQKNLMREKKYGATMRLGAQKIRIKLNTVAYKAYKKEEIFERFRHRYEINPKYIEILERGGFVFSGTTTDGKIMQIGELPKHKFFVGTQFHPEFTSSPLKPNPLFYEFIKVASKF